MRTHAHVVYDIVKIMLEHDDIYNARVGRSKAGGVEEVGRGGVSPHRHYKGWILLVQVSVHLKSLLDIVGKTLRQKHFCVCVILAVSSPRNSIRFHL